MILGSTLEASVQQALIVSGADIWTFVKRPISAMFLIIAALSMLIPLFKWGWKKFFPSPSG